DPEARNLVGGEIDDLAEEASRQQPRHLGERHVHGGEHHLERLGPEHHRDTRRARQLRQQIGVSLHGSPARENPSLFTGAVAIADTRPSIASRTAAQIASYAACPASADSTPGSKREPSGAL